MRKSWVTTLCVLAGIGLMLAGAGIVMWYSTDIIPPEEVARLEAGGNGEATWGETIALLSSPVLIAVGVLLLGVAWSRRRRQLLVDRRSRWMQ